MGGQETFPVKPLHPGSIWKKTVELQRQAIFYGKKESLAHRGKGRSEGRAKSYRNIIPRKEQASVLTNALRTFAHLGSSFGPLSLQVAFSRLVFSHGVSATHPGTALGNSVVSTECQGLKQATRLPPFKGRGLGRHRCRGWNPLGTINMTNNHRKEVES